MNAASADEQLIRALYAGFNARDIDGVLALLADDVVWANGMEETHVHGHEAVRAYWTAQWTTIDPHVEPLSVSKIDDGRIAVGVRLVVRNLDGEVMLDETIEHLFRIEDGKVKRFDIREGSQLSRVVSNG